MCSKSPKYPEDGCGKSPKGYGSHPSGLRRGKRRLQDDYSRISHSRFGCADILMCSKSPKYPEDGCGRPPKGYGSHPSDLRRGKRRRETDDYSRISHSRSSCDHQHGRRHNFQHHLHHHRHHQHGRRPLPPSSHAFPLSVVQKCKDDVTRLQQCRKALAEHVQSIPDLLIDDLDTSSMDPDMMPDPSDLFSPDDFDEEPQPKQSKHSDP